MRLPQRRLRPEHLAVARVVLGLLVPGVWLLAAGRPELIIYAVFGSFTGTYGRDEPAPSRLRHQFHGAGMLVTGTALGVTLADTRAGPAVLVLGVTAFATAASLITAQLRLQPAGPFFGIFALGATATVPPDLVTPWTAIVICVGTATFCMALGQATEWLLRRRSPAIGALTPRGLALRLPRSLPRGSLAQALRYALGTSLAGGTGLLLGVDHANWAMASAAVPLSVIAIGEPRDLGAVARRGLIRLGGTAAGLAVTALILLPRPGPEVLVIVVVALLFPTELFLSRRYGLALGFFTPLIMIMTELVTPAAPLELIVDRGLDTVIGVVAGIAAAVLVRGPREGFDDSDG